MPIDIATLHERLESIGINVQVPPDAEAAQSQRGLVFGTDRYRNIDGEPSLLVVATIAENGRYLEFYAPMAFNARECRHKGALFAAAMHVAMRTKHLQCEYDPADGEVRFAIDVPVCDGDVTAEQLEAMVRGIVTAIDLYAPVFVHVMETGRLDLSLAEPKQEAEPISGELAELLQAIGGIEALREIAAERRLQEEAE
jgi:hypothetical protein